MRLSVSFVAALLGSYLMCSTAFTPSSSLKLALKQSAFLSRPNVIRYATVPQEAEQQVSKEVVEANTESKSPGGPIPYSELSIGVLKETLKGENRVSQSPDGVRMLVKEGFKVLVQEGGMQQ
jgi:hypothetical protein